MLKRQRLVPMRSRGHPPIHFSSDLPQRNLFYDHHHLILSSTMSLLTPTEAVTFQTFLSSLNYTESYNGPTPAEWMLLHHGVRHPDDPEPSFPEAPRLKKATLDLMSLDVPGADNFSPSGTWHRSPTHSKQSYPYPIQADRAVPSDRPSLVIENVRQIYPPHSSSSSPPSAGITLPSSTSPYPSATSDVLRSSTGRLPTRSSSKRSFDTVSLSAPAQLPESTSYSSTTQRAKRSRRSTPPPQRTSDPSQSPPPSSSRQPAQTQEGASSSSRSQLLSASQKRANHIQSEQKRRANIRRGYEALCESVPALKEAIRKEEEEAATMLANAGGGSSRNVGRKKKAKNTNDDGEKIDGRAGPRSENIVLQKSRECCAHLYALC